MSQHRSSKRKVSNSVSYLWLGVWALGSTLLFSPAMAQPLLVHSSPAKQHFDIPAQGLSTALTAFALQSGLQISVDSQLLAGRISSGLTGSHSMDDALSLLLKDSGLAWRYTEDGTLLIEPGPGYQAGTEQDQVRLNDILVRGVRDSSDYRGSTSINRSTIEGMPAGNGDITSLLRIHPSVQFDDSQLSSKTPGEISPANISINGALPWQNLFLVDGMGMNNDIDPGNTSNTYSEVPGRSQGLALDTDLLQEIRVYDSNVPASYGGFNGGVVDARTRNPSRELSGKLSAQMSRSKWTEYHLNSDDPELDAFEAAVGSDNHPEFDKLTTRATLEGYLNDSFGLLTSFSRKTSTIPTRPFTLGHTSEVASQQHDRKSRIDNLFLKGIWHINDDWDLDFSLTHAPESDRGYGSNAINSYRELLAGGDKLNLKLSWNASLGRLEQYLSWDRQENTRRSQSQSMRIWRWSEAQDWSGTNTASEGGFGDIEQRQTSLAYKLVMDWRSVSTLGFEHAVQSGLEFSDTSAWYRRAKPYYTNAITATASTDWCDADDVWCSLGDTVNGWPGQYINAYTLTEARKIDLDTRSWAVFLQDDIRYKRLRLRPGVRVDSDDFMDKTTVSPRFVGEYDLFGNSRTLITAGANRYYGRNLYTYRLRDGVAAMQVRYTRDDQNAEWVQGERVANGARFNQLDIPYDDELSLAISHIQWDTNFTLEYINRKGRKQISRAWGSQIGQPSPDTSELAANYYTYYNGGKSESDIIKLIITPLGNLQLWNTISHAQLIVDWSDINKSGLSDYTSNIGLLYVDDPIIQYDGSFIRYSDRPADNYSRPWTVRLQAMTHIPQWNLTWTNFFRHRDGFRRIAGTAEQVDYNGEQVRVWTEKRFGSALTWDTRLAWELPMANKGAPFVNLDVTNLLNRRIVSSAPNADIARYEIGRQFMLEVGYRF